MGLEKMSCIIVNEDIFQYVDRLRDETFIQSMEIYRPWKFKLVSPPKNVI